MAKTVLQKTLTTIKKLLAEYQYEQPWDYCIVSDGSGTTWKSAIGWCSTLVRNDGSKIVFHGGWNHGTNNVAELFGCLQPVIYMIANEQYSLQGTTVVVLTDSQFVANQINKNRPPKKNKELWTALLSANRYGIVLKAIWTPRATNVFNMFADKIAGECRVQQEEILNKK